MPPQLKQVLQLGLGVGVGVGVGLGLGLGLGHGRLDLLEVQRLDGRGPVAVVQLT